MPTIRNIIIFVVIAAIFVSIYIFYIKSNSSTQENLVSSAPVTQSPVSATPPTSSSPASSSASSATAPATDDPALAQNFLTLLLGVEKIELKDGIFADTAFQSLHDSSITLTSDGTEGRVNPFAPLGTDFVNTLPASTSITPTATSAPSGASSTSAPVTH